MKKSLIPRVLNFYKRSILFWIPGFFAFLWIVLRSGMNPKRLAYPCQQAAYPMAAAWFSGIVSFIPGVVFSKRVVTVAMALIFVLILGLALLFKSQLLTRAGIVIGNYPVWESENAISEIFIVKDMPPTSGSLAAGDASVPDTYLNDPGMDMLFSVMAEKGLYLHKTKSQPEGITGPEDVVIIKANFQWRHRMSTNTDRIKGLIWQILNHPEGFNGEILVCDNQESQIWPEKWLSGFNDYSNNSEDPEQSIVDVVNTFKAKGYPVDYYVWDSLNNSTVSEYIEGDLTDGYIFDPEALTSYPKFLSPKGNYISLMNGIWDNDSRSYNKERLTIINFPVLKAHGIVGATIALKNFIGVMNTTKHDEWYGGEVDETFHPLYCFSEYALVAREMDICWPKLNIIDATWVASINNYNYNQRVLRLNTVLASVDPVASSWYSAKYLLKPVARFPKNVDPDYYKNKYYGTVLNHWYNYLKNHTERVVTKTRSEISVYGKEVLK